MSDTIVLTGIVATPPRHIVTAEQLPITSFRLASTQRRFDRSQQRWVDGDTNWYTVTSFRQLATNAAGSIGKGDRVVVSGRLRIRDWDTGERKGTNIDVEADVIGHDLAWGTSSYTRTMSTSSAAQQGEAQQPAQTWPGDASNSGSSDAEGTGSESAASEDADASAAGADSKATLDAEAVPTPF
jgi:single-strand DNA-binding protein